MDAPYLIMIKESTTIQRVETVPTVTLVVTSPEGRVQGFLSGESSSMAALLATVAADNGNQVRTTTDSFLQPGQSVYEVERDFVLLSRANLTFLPWSVIQSLDENLPSGSKLFFVVSY